MRNNNPFELFIIENEKKYLKISKNRINIYNKLLNLKKPSKINFFYSDVQMTLFVTAEKLL